MYPIILFSYIVKVKYEINIMVIYNYTCNTYFSIAWCIKNQFVHETDFCQYMYVFLKVVHCTWKIVRMLIINVVII